MGLGLVVLAGGLGCVGFCFLLVLGFIKPLRKQSRVSFALQNGLSVLAISDLQLAALASLQATEPVYCDQASVWVVESVYRWSSQCIGGRVSVMVSRSPGVFREHAFIYAGFKK